MELSSGTVMPITRCYIELMDLLSLTLTELSLGLTWVCATEWVGLP